ncbi:conserved hypothetical protein [Actinacidiphila bryophytorum]|uniref:Uncharacterized protein n=1 Tax=Actinacidiphila bryophytorum TaxID=1436133 RepID=A0A9W4MI84_9ACTN|nr:conserved hypothetical protein [Actinacidiphila bryophytorum]
MTAPRRPATPMPAWSRAAAPPYWPAWAPAATRCADGAPPADDHHPHHRQGPSATHGDPSRRARGGLRRRGRHRRLRRDHRRGLAAAAARPRCGRAAARAFHVPDVRHAFDARDAEPCRPGRPGAHPQRHAARVPADRAGHPRRRHPLGAAGPGPEQGRHHPGPGQAPAGRLVPRLPDARPGRSFGHPRPRRLVRHRAGRLLPARRDEAAPADPRHPRRPQGRRLHRRRRPLLRQSGLPHPRRLRQHPRRRTAPHHLQRLERAHPLLRRQHRRLRAAHHGLARSCAPGPPIHSGG